MKNIGRVLIAAAAVVTLAAIVSRLTITPLLGLESRAMAGFAALLLLFAIALEKR